MRIRGQDGYRRAPAIIVAAASLTAFGLGAAHAACPTVADPQGLTGQWNGQVEVEDLAGKGVKLTYSQNPIFDKDVEAGKLPRVEDRLPQEPLVLLPYESCGVYGGTLNGLARAPESGTSDILSWRQVALVRIGDDLKTIQPNVARSWKWADDYKSITFELRKGHKWSDGQLFTADDVVFFFEDIVKNKEMSPDTTTEWGLNPTAEKIDETHVKVSFDEPFPGLLTYMATSGSYFATFAPKHHFAQYLPKYNPNADADAKAAGFENWVKAFDSYYDKWKDAETLTAHALTVPTLESHIIEVEPDTQHRVFKANPYYFKVDSSGQQLPYIDHHYERFLNLDLQLLSILNGEADYKAQGLDLTQYPTLKEKEASGKYTVRMANGSIGPAMAFNITHNDQKLRSVYSDLRFRQAISHALNRAEINDVIYFGMGKPSQALPAQISFATEADANYMIDYDVAKASALLDDMGMKKGADGMRTYPDGSPFTILWEYSTQMALPEYVKLVSDQLKAVGLKVNAKELTSAATRENAKAETSDINMEWDVPYEPTLIADVSLYTPYYSEISPLFGVKWKQWWISNGASGEEPPAWAKRMFEIAKEWKTVVPGTERYMELGRELVKLNLENMTIVGTIGELPKPIIVSNRLHNVKPELGTAHFNFGYSYAFRADQWYIQE